MTSVGDKTYKDFEYMPHIDRLAILFRNTLQQTLEVLFKLLKVLIFTCIDRRLDQRPSITPHMVIPNKDTLRSEQRHPHFPLLLNTPILILCLKYRLDVHRVHGRDDGRAEEVALPCFAEPVECGLHVREVLGGFECFGILERVVESERVDVRVVRTWFAAIGVCLAVGAELLDENEDDAEDGKGVIDVDLIEVEEHDEGRYVLPDPGPKCVGIQGE